MHRPRIARTVVLVAALSAASVLAAGAPAADPAPARSRTVVVRSVALPALGSARARPRPAALPIAADLIGLRWRGTAGAIDVRVHRPNAGWSRWLEVTSAADGPDGAWQHGRDAQVSDPIWVGGADSLQVRRALGQPAPQQLEAIAVRSPAMPTGRIAPTPLVHRRGEWAAAAPAAVPRIAEEGIRGAVIHHTAGANTYACGDVPALLRGIQAYHMQTQGWNDIGYNFLVDRCGGVWEGRAGGIRNAVIGAHTAGFNTGTVGVAILGTTSTVSATPAAQRALSQLLSWRLDLAHVRPTGRMTLTARSANGTYVAGQSVAVRAVSGHRDLYSTECPGEMTYGQLDALARRAWMSGGIKVATASTTITRRYPQDPQDGEVASVRVRAVVNDSRAFATARFVQTSTGTTLQRIVGRGPVLDGTWTAAPGQQVPEWDVSLVINAATSSPQRRARPVQRQIVAAGADPAFVITQALPPTIAAGASIEVSYTVSRAAQLGAWLVDPVTRAPVAQLRAASSIAAAVGTPAQVTISVPASTPPGVYELRIGLSDDDARGRSIRRAPITVTAAG